MERATLEKIMMLGAVGLMGLLLVIGGANAILGAHSSSAPANGAAILQQPAGTGAVQQPSGSGQVQEVTISTGPGGYQLSAPSVKKGVLVRMTGDLSKLYGCMRALTIPQLGVSKIFSQGDNVLEFTPQKEGTFLMSCSMGMGRGQLVVTA